jgi:serine/threonine protein phosphatase PrpC
MDHQQAVDFVREALKQDDDPQVACKALGEEAYKKGSQDNITGNAVLPCLCLNGR